MSLISKIFNKFFVFTLLLFSGVFAFVGCSFSDALKKSSEKKAANTLTSPTVVFNSEGSGLIEPGSFAFTISSDDTGAFPSYQVWIDSVTTTFKIKVDKDGNPVEVLDSNSTALPREYAKVIKTTANQVSGIESGKWIVLLNPHLSSGNTSRVFKVKAIANPSSNQTSSAYSVPVTFSVRKLTFEAYSMNSLSTDFGYLSYNSDKYFFAVNKTRAVSTGNFKTYHLEGYFPDGRDVQVSRTLLNRTGNTTKYDYEFQSWTVSQRANLFKAITNKSGFVTNDQSSSCVSAGDNYVLTNDTLNSEKTFSTISVKANSSNAGKTFYANFLKVDNFSVAGTVFNGNNIGTSDKWTQAGVEITIHNNANIIYVSNLIKGTFGSDSNKNNDGIIAYTQNGSNYTIYDLFTNNNGEFEITGLSKDAHVTFAYTGTGSETTALGATTAGVDYTIHSANFAENSTNLLIEKMDKENIDITATAFKTGSNLDVDVDLVLDGEANKGSIRYEIVKGLTSTEEDGYVTSTILISVIPSQGTMLTGYTINTPTKNEIFFAFAFDHDNNSATSLISLSNYLKYNSETGKYEGVLYSPTDGLNKIKVVVTLDSSGNPVSAVLSEGVVGTITNWTFNNENEAFDQSGTIGGKPFAASLIIGKSNSSVQASVFSTDMKDSSNNTIYVNYDIVKESEKNFYTSPLAVTTDGGSSYNQIFKNSNNNNMIANFSSLKSANKIILGETIREATSGDVALFKLAVGAALRDDYYYYVAPLGSPIDAFFKQFSTTSTENKTANELGILTANGLTYLTGDFSGNTVSFTSSTSGVAQVSETGKYFYVKMVGVKNVDTSTYIFGTNNNVVLGSEIKTNQANYAGFLLAVGGSLNLSDNNYYYVAELQSVLSETKITYTSTKHFTFATLSNSVVPIETNSFATIIVLGKIIPSSKGFITYPSMLKNGNTVPYAMSSDLASKAYAAFQVAINEPTSVTERSYTIDLTSNSIIKAGFPGVLFMSGAPYANPVIKIEVKHLASDSSISITLNVNSIYYVELLGTLVEREEYDVVVDFSSFAFKDAETNIFLNADKYVDKQATVVSANGLSIFTLPYVGNDGKVYEKYLPVEDFAVYANNSKIYYTGSDANILKYCATNNSTDAAGNVLGKIVYSKLTRGSNTLEYSTSDSCWKLNGTKITTFGTTTNATTISDILSNGSKTNALSASDFKVWTSSPDALEDIAFFDIHSFNEEVLAELGKLLLSSDCDSETACSGLLNLSGTDILAGDFSDVVISGVTSAYRIDKNTYDLYKTGFFSATSLELNKSESTTDPYFYLSSDAVALVADPLVELSNTNRLDSVRYRFSGWVIYERYSSEIIYLVQGATDANVTGNAIMYFAPEKQGYYLMLPIYEKIYEVNAATEVENGAKNSGGTVSALHDSLTGKYISSETLYNTYFVKLLSKNFEVSRTYSVESVVIEETVYDLSSPSASNVNLQRIGNDNAFKLTFTWTVGSTVTNYTKNLETESELQSIKSTYFATDLTGTSFELKLKVPNKNDSNYDGYLYLSSNGSIIENSLPVAQLFEKNFVYFKASEEVPSTTSTPITSSTEYQPTAWLFDRHTNVTLVAMANSGYRLEGWYAAYFDKATGTYIISDEPVSTTSAHYIDAVSIPSNVLIFNGTNYFKPKFEYIDGLFQLVYTQTTYSNGNYVLFNGILYASNNYISSNKVYNLNAFSSSTGSYDDYIEWFNYETLATLANASINGVSITTSTGTHTATINTETLSLTSKSAGFDIHIKVISVQELSTGVYVVKYQNLDATAGTITGNELATEVFYASSSGQFYLSRDIQNLATLVATKVYTVTSTLTYVDADTRMIGEVEYDFDGTYLIIGSNKYLVTDNTITRYYLVMQNQTYMGEVFDFNSTTSTFFKVAAKTISGDNTNRPIFALQTPFVDFIVNQITANDKSGEQMQLSYLTGFDGLVEINDFSLDISYEGIDTNDNNVFKIIATLGEFSTTQIYTEGEILYITFGENTIVIAGISINVNGSGVADGSFDVNLKPDQYAMSSTLLFFDPIDKELCRVKIEGNLNVEGNSLTINSLYDNVFFVAKFIETYRTMTLVDDDSETPAVEVKEIFYYNKADNTKAIRTVQGSAVSDPQVAGSILPTATYGFGYKKSDNSISEIDLTNGNYTYNQPTVRVFKNGSNYYLTRTGSVGNYTYSEKVDVSNGTLTETSTENEYTFVSQEYSYFYNALTNGGYSISDGSNPGKRVLSEKLSNKWYTFDTGTTILLVVQVKKGISLTASSLGLEKVSNLRFILQPSDTYIKNTDKDYYFYVVEITFDRATDNTYVSDLNHAKRYSSIKADLSAKEVFLNSTNGNYYFEKAVRYDTNNNLEYVFKNQLSTADTGYVARKITTIGATIQTTYYYVPVIDDISDSSLACFGASYVNSKSTSRPTNYIKDGVTVVSDAGTIRAGLGTSSSSLVQINSAYPNNYVNLSTITIYTYTISAITFSNGDGSDLDANGSLINSNNVIHKWTEGDFIYAFGGADFAGQKISILGDVLQIGTETREIGNSVREFNKYVFTNQAFAQNGALDKLSVVANSIIYLNTPTADYFDIISGKTYRFAGWFEQKKIMDVTNSNGIKIGEVWSELSDEPLSTDLVSHISLSTADTNIIAVYKEVFDVSLTYNPNEMKVFELNYSKDSTGATIVPVENGDGTLTVSGLFDYDANLTLNVTPDGGFRMKEVTFNENTISHNNGENAILTGKLQFSLNKGSGAYVVSMQKVVAVVMKIENYSAVQKLINNFQIKSTDGTITYFDTAYLEVKQAQSSGVLNYTYTYTLPETGITKDTANHFMEIQNKIPGTSNTLTVAGWFDEGTEIEVVQTKTASESLDSSSTYYNEAAAVYQFAEFDGWYVNKAKLHESQNIETLSLTSSTGGVVEALGICESIYSTSLSVTTSNTTNEKGILSQTLANEIWMSLNYHSGTRYVFNDGVYTPVNPDNSSYVQNNHELSDSEIEYKTLILGGTYAPSLTIASNFINGAATFFFNSDSEISLSISDRFKKIESTTYKFVGWVINEKIASESLTYSVPAENFRSNLDIEARYVLVNTVSLSDKLDGTTSTENFGQTSIDTTSLTLGNWNSTTKTLTVGDYTAEGYSYSVLPIGGDPAQIFNNKARIVFTAHPGTNYCVQGWTVSVDGQSVVITGTGTNTTLSGLSIVVADSELGSITIFVNTSSTQNISVVCDYVEAYEIVVPTSMIATGMTSAKTNTVVKTMGASSSSSSTATLASTIDTAGNFGTVAISGPGYISNTGRYKAGSVLTFTATPNDGYTLFGWLVNGEFFAATRGSTGKVSNLSRNETVDRDLSVQPLFVQEFQIKITTVQNSSSTLTTYYAFNQEDLSSVLTAEEISNFSFICWLSKISGNWQVVTENTILSTNATANIEYAKAYLTHKEVTLAEPISSSREKAVGGTAYISNIITVLANTITTKTYFTSADQTISLLFGSTTFVAIPATGYQFVGWFDQNGNLVSKNANLSFANLSLVSITSIEPRFAESINVNVFVKTNLVSSSVGGYVNTNNATPTYQDNITLLAYSNNGYRFDGFFVNGTKITSDNLDEFGFTNASIIGSRLTFSATQHVSIEARFSTAVVLKIYLQKIINESNIINVSYDWTTYFESSIISITENGEVVEINSDNVKKDSSNIWFIEITMSKGSEIEFNFNFADQNFTLDSIAEFGIVRMNGSGSETEAFTFSIDSTRTMQINLSSIATLSSPIETDNGSIRIEQITTNGTINQITVYAEPTRGWSFVEWFIMIDEENSTSLGVTSPILTIDSNMLTTIRTLLSNESITMEDVLTLVENGTIFGEIIANHTVAITAGANDTTGQVSIKTSTGETITNSLDSTNPSITVFDGTPVVLTAPKTLLGGTRIFTGFRIDGKYFATANECNLTDGIYTQSLVVLRNITVEAVYETARTITLSANLNGNVSGAIVTSISIDGNLTNETAFANGSLLTISAPASTSSRKFVGWFTMVMGEEVLVSSSSTTTIVLDSNMTLFAKYVDLVDFANTSKVLQTYNSSTSSFSYAIAAGSVGTTSASPLAAYHGSNVTLSAVPSNGYVFVGWFETELNGTNRTLVSASRVLSTTVNANKKIEAVFAAAIQFNITTNATEKRTSLEINGVNTTTIFGYAGMELSVSADATNFMGWFNGSTLVSADNSFTHILSAAVTVQARYSSITVSVSTETNGETSTAGGSIKIDGASISSKAYAYSADTTITLNATANSGYQFVGWFTMLVAEKKLLSTNATMTFAATESKQLFAEFKQVFTVSVSTTGAGSVSGVPTSSLLYGTTINLIATPASSTIFVGWFDGSNHLISNELTLNTSVTTNLEIVAKFGTKSKLSLTSNLSSTTLTGAGDYETASTVSISATAVEGFRFDGWYTSAGLQVSTELEIDFELNENITLVAKFVKVFDVSVDFETIDATNGEGITHILTGAGIYDKNETATITATAASGYQFTGWIINGVFKAKSSTVGSTLVLDVTDATNVIAVFAKTVTVTTGTIGSGSGSVTNTVSSTYGKTITLVANPASSQNLFTGWFIGGNQITTQNNQGLSNVVFGSNSLTFTATTNITIIAKFDSAVKVSLASNIAFKDLPSGTILTTETMKIISVSPTGSTVENTTGTFGAGTYVTIKAPVIDGYFFYGFYEQTESGLTLVETIVENGFNTCTYVVSNEAVLIARYEKATILTIRHANNHTLGIFDASNYELFVFDGITSNSGFIININSDGTVVVPKNGLIQITTDVSNFNGWFFLASETLSTGTIVSSNRLETSNVYIFRPAEVSASTQQVYLLSTTNCAVGDLNSPVSLAVTATTGGSVSESTVSGGQTKTITATAGAGYRFIGWYQQFGPTAASLFLPITTTNTVTVTYPVDTRYCEVVDENGTTYTGYFGSLQARFEKIVTISVSTLGEGTVVGNGDYAVEYDSTTENYTNFAYLTAIAKEGYVFAGWFYNNGTKDAQIVNSGSSANWLRSAVFGQNSKIDGNKIGFAVYENLPFLAGGTVYAKFVQECKITLVSNTSTTLSGAGTYAAGTSVTVTAPAKTGFRFAGWFNGETLISNNLSHTFTASANITLTAAYVKTWAISIDGTASTVDDGSTIVLTPASISGKAFVGWTINNEFKPVSADDNFVLSIAVNGNLTISSVFANIHNATITTANGTVFANGNEVVSGTPFEFEENETTTLLAVANENYKFVGWFNGTTLVSSNENHSFTSTSNVSLEARFALKTYVILTSNVNATLSGSGEHAAGTTVTVSTAAISGYAFVGWFDGTTQKSTNLTYSFTMASTGITLEARFVQRVTISISTSTAGTTTLHSISGSGPKNLGSSVTITATPAIGYAFVGWQVNGKIISTSSTYTFIATENAAYTAMFAQNVSITAAIANANYVLASGRLISSTSTTAQVTYGSFILFFAKHSNSNELFSNWTVAGSTVSTTGLNFTATQATTIAANFTNPTRVSVLLSSNVTGATTNGSGVYTTGSSVSISANAPTTENTTYNFVGWFNGATLVSTSNAYNFTASSNANFEARFEIVHTVSATISTNGANNAGNIVSIEDSTVVEGNFAYLSATTAEGYRFVSWTINGKTISTESSIEILITKSTTVVANFAQVFTTTIQIESMGTVTVFAVNSQEKVKIAESSLSENQTEISVEFDNASTASLVAHSSYGHRFVGWYDESNNLISTDLTRNITVSTNITIKAVFEEVYTVLSNAEYISGGTVSGISIDKTIDGDGKVTLTAPLSYVLSNGNAEFKNWTIITSYMKTQITAENFAELLGADATLSVVGENSVLSFTPSSDIQIAAIYSQTSTSSVVTLQIDGVPASFAITDRNGNPMNYADDEFEIGELYIFTAPTIAGKRFAGWKDASGNLLGTLQSFSLTITPDSTTLNAVYLEQHTISVTVTDKNGTTAQTRGTVVGAGTYLEGETVTLNAHSNANFIFVGWYDNDGLVEANETYSFTAENDVTLTARFAESVNLSVSTNKGGNVVSLATNGNGLNSHSAFFDSNKTTLTKVEVGSTVTLTANTYSGYIFTGWFNGATLLSTNLTYSYTASTNVEITAQFEKAYNVSVNETSNATVAKKANGSSTTATSFTDGTTMQFIATPSAGFVVTGWFVNGILQFVGDDVFTSSTLTFTLEQDVNVQVVVAQTATITVTHSVTDGLGGNNTTNSFNSSTPATISGTNNTSESNFAVGSYITLKAEKSNAFAFVGWFDGSELVSTSRNFTFVVTEAMAGQSIQYVAKYAELTKTITIYAPSHADATAIISVNGSPLAETANGTLTVESTTYPYSFVKNADEYVLALPVNFAETVTVSYTQLPTWRIKNNAGTTISDPSVTPVETTLVSVLNPLSSNITFNPTFVKLFKVEFVMDFYDIVNNYIIVSYTDSNGTTQSSRSQPNAEYNQQMQSLIVEAGTVVNVSLTYTLNEDFTFQGWALYNNGLLSEWENETWTAWKSNPSSRSSVAWNLLSGSAKGYTRNQNFSVTANSNMSFIADDFVQFGGYNETEQLFVFAVIENQLYASTANKTTQISLSKYLFTNGTETVSTLWYDLLKVEEFSNLFFTQNSTENAISNGFNIGGLKVVSIAKNANGTYSIIYVTNNNTLETGTITHTNGSISVLANEQGKYAIINSISENENGTFNVKAYCVASESSSTPISTQIGLSFTKDFEILSAKAMKVNKQGGISSMISTAELEVSYSAISGIESRRTATITAPKIEHMTFLGFAIKNNVATTFAFSPTGTTMYKYDIEESQYVSNNNFTLGSYSFVSSTYNETAQNYETTITLSSNVEIVALYEAEIFVVDINKFAVFTTSMDGTFTIDTLAIEKIETEDGVNFEITYKVSNGASTTTTYTTGDKFDIGGSGIVVRQITFVNNVDSSDGYNIYTEETTKNGTVKGNFVYEYGDEVEISSSAYHFGEFMGYEYDSDSSNANNGNPAKISGTVGETETTETPTLSIGNLMLITKQEATSKPAKQTLTFNIFEDVTFAAYFSTARYKVSIQIAEVVGSTSLTESEKTKAIKLPDLDLYLESYTVNYIDNQPVFSNVVLKQGLLTITKDGYGDVISLNSIGGKVFVSGTMTSATISIEFYVEAKGGAGFEIFDVTIGNVLSSSDSSVVSKGVGTKVQTETETSYEFINITKFDIDNYNDIDFESTGSTIEINDINLVICFQKLITTVQTGNVSSKGVKANSSDIVVFKGVGKFLEYVQAQSIGFNLGSIYSLVQSAYRTNGSDSPGTADDSITGADSVHITNEEIEAIKNQMSSTYSAHAEQISKIVNYIIAYAELYEAAYKYELFNKLDTAKLLKEEMPTGIICLLKIDGRNYTGTLSNENGKTFTVANDDTNGIYKNLNFVINKSNFTATHTYSNGEIVTGSILFAGKFEIKDSSNNKLKINGLNTEIAYELYAKGTTSVTTTYNDMVFSKISVFTDHEDEVEHGKRFLGRPWSATKAYNYLPVYTYSYAGGTLQTSTETVFNLTYSGQTSMSQSITDENQAPSLTYWDTIYNYFIGNFITLPNLAHNTLSTDERSGHVDIHAFSIITNDVITKEGQNVNLEIKRQTDVDRLVTYEYPYEKTPWEEVLNRWGTSYAMSQIPGESLIFESSRNMYFMLADSLMNTKFTATQKRTTEELAAMQIVFNSLIENMLGGTTYNYELQPQVKTS